MSKRRQKGNKESIEALGVDELIGIIKGVAIAPSIAIVLRTALPAAASALLGPGPWSPRASLVFSMPSLPKSR
jgi:hypothetical protein